MHRQPTQFYPRAFKLFHLIHRFLSTTYLLLHSFSFQWLRMVAGRAFTFRSCRVHSFVLFGCGPFGWSGRVSLDKCHSSIFRCSHESLLTNAYDCVAFPSEKFDNSFIEHRLTDPLHLIFQKLSQKQSRVSSSCAIMTNYHLLPWSRGLTRA